MSKLVHIDDVRRGVLLRLIDAGVPPKLACARAGVSLNAVRQWLAYGEQVALGAVDITEPGAQEALQFWERYHAAISESAIQMFEVMRERALSGDASAAKWVYEQYDVEIQNVSEPKKDEKQGSPVVAVVFNMPNGEVLEVGPSETVLRDNRLEISRQPPSLPSPSSGE